MTVLPARVRISAIYFIELVAIAFIYFWLVKLGLTLASINPSASPVWPAAGFALAILLLRGYRIWPAIFVGAFLANVSSAGSIYTSAAIATGNSLEGVVGTFLINRWSGGVRTFTTPAGIVKFALISAAATAISPVIGVSSLSFGGYAEWAGFGPIFISWWLGDLAGALVVAPVLVLWANDPRTPASETIAIFVVAASIGLIAFSPVIEQTVNRTPLAFLAVAPLVWTALRRDPRDTSTAALILAGFAVWGTSVGGGPFSWAGFNESFVLLVMFVVSAAMPSLMLSAMAAELRNSHATLERKVEERTHQLERDITRRKEAEQHQQVLVAELDHRVKNILAQVAVVAASSRQGSHSIDGFLRSLDGRIQSMAAAHTLLSKSGWQSVGLDALVRNQLAPYATDMNITISGTDVMLTAAETQAVARVLHELATNAAKHGALSIPAGHVSVNWDRKSNALGVTAFARGANLSIVWQEFDGPTVKSEAQSSYGTHLIRNLIPHELGGKVDLVFASDGVSCRIEIPMRQA